MQVDKATLKKIEELCQKYEETWGKKVDYKIIPNGITQEKFVKCLELMIADNLSLLVAYNKLFKKQEHFSEKGELNLFDYYDSTDFRRFQTEKRLLFEMLSCQKDKEKMKEVLKRHSADGMVDKESAKAILGIINEKVNLEKIMKKDEHGREVYDMCQAFEDYKEEGREEMALENVKKLMQKQKLSFEAVMELLELPMGMQNELRKLI